jgi:hypothetical protein
MKMKLRTGKKCIPGLFCVENFTLFVIIVLLIIVYMYVSYSRRNGVCVWRKRKRRQTERDSREHPAAPSVPNALSNPYYPPLKSELPVFSSGVPINIQTRPPTRTTHRSGY